MQPATIKLFLTDGKPAGIRTAEISNWTGKAIAGPHSELTKLLQREELLSPGIYFLTGVDAETDMPTLYIGEAESVVKRLKQHDKREWNQVAAFVSKDENLTKAHIRYLEGALIVRANHSNAVQVLNNASSGAKLPESDQAEMDVFLEKVLQLLPLLSLGNAVDAFKIIESNDDPLNINNSESVLTCSIKGFTAKGKRTANGFVVFNGSQAVAIDRASSNRIKKKREQYLKDGLLPYPMAKPMSPDHGTQILRLCNSHWPEVIAGLLCWKPAKLNHLGKLPRKKASTTATSAEWLT